MNGTTRRGFLASSTIIATAGCAGIGGSRADTEQQTDAKTPDGNRFTTASAGEYITDSQGTFGYAVVDASAHDTLPAEPFDLPNGTDADSVEPPAGWQLVTVEMKVRNESDVSQRPPRPYTIFGVAVGDGRLVREGRREVSLRATGCTDCSRFDAGVDTALDLPGRYLHRATWTDALASGEIGRGWFAALVSDDAAPDELYPAMGVNGTDGETYPARWVVEITETTDE